MPALLAVWSITEAGTPLEELRRDEQVDDVEDLVAGVIGRVCAAHELRAVDRDELRDALFEKVLVLIAKYDRRRDDPRQAARLAFRPWLFRELQLDAIDELRRWHGRRGERRVVDTRSFERVASSGDVFNELDGDHPVDRSASVEAGHADPARDARALPREWTDLRPDRRRARPLEGLGEDPDRAAA
jgi:hypothetical protein